MSILKRIDPVRASYDGSSFHIPEDIELTQGTELFVLEMPEDAGAYPDRVTVVSASGGLLDIEEEALSPAEGDEAVFGIVTELADPKSLQWDVEDLEGASGRNQAGRYFRDVIAAKRKLSCTWGAMGNTEMAELLSTMEEVFFTMEYPDALTGERRISEFYTGGRSTPMLMQREDGTYMWQELSAVFTER